MNKPLKRYNQGISQTRDTNAPWWQPHQSCRDVTQHPPPLPSPTPTTHSHVTCGGGGGVLPVASYRVIRDDRTLIENRIDIQYYNFRLI